MTSPDDPPGPSDDQAPGPRYADRAYRSMPGVVSGVLLLAIGVWLVADAVVRGEGRTPWLALAGLLMAAPVVIAFTLRPVVLAGHDRMVVRNPFRTITLPWSAVDGVRAGYSTEVLAEGTKYQLWAIPVSLRQRKHAARQRTRAAAQDPFARSASSVRTSGAVPAPARAWSDAAVDELSELAEENRERDGAVGEVSVRWCWEVIAPALAGAVVLLILSVTG